MSNNLKLVRKKLEEKKEKEGEKVLQNIIVVLELPFVIEEKELAKYFVKCEGGIKNLDIERSGALVFAAAIVEFNKPKGCKKALELAAKYAGAFDVVVVSATDFLADKIPMKKPEKVELTAKEKKECLIQ